MITTIVVYVNCYFPHYKTKFYCDNFIKSSLVYKYHYKKYFSRNLDMDQIIYRLTEAQNSVKTNSVILVNHYSFLLLFAHSGNSIPWGEDVFMSLTQEYETIEFFTGILYWCFHEGVV